MLDQVLRILEFFLNFAELLAELGDLAVFFLEKLIEIFVGIFQLLFEKIILVLYLLAVAYRNLDLLDKTFALFLFVLKTLGQFFGLFLKIGDFFLTAFYVLVELFGVVDVNLNWTTFLVVLFRQISSKNMLENVSKS
jgi:hypothetical protein